MGSIELNDAPAEPQRQMHGSSFPRSRHIAQRPAGEEHEDFGGIRERKLGVGEAAVIDARDMVDKNCRERESAPKVDGVGLTKHCNPRKRSGNSYATRLAVPGECTARMISEIIRMTPSRLHSAIPSQRFRIDRRRGAARDR